jgi:hypothetical protein
MQHPAYHRPSPVALLVTCVLLANCRAAKPDAPHDYQQAAPVPGSLVPRPVPVLAPRLGVPTSSAPAANPLPEPLPFPLVNSGKRTQSEPVDDAKWTPIPDEELKRIEEALRDCADIAHSDVLRKHLGGKRPTDEECDRMVDVEIDGKKIRMKLARWLGLEMHTAARLCVEKKLGSLIPGRFTTEQRYRRVPKRQAHSEPDRNNQGEWRTEAVPSNKEKSLSYDEKRGTIVPDVTINTGLPLEVQAVFDFKFPCKSNQITGWDVYPPGSPYQYRTQADVYREFLKAPPRIIRPRRP